MRLTRSSTRCATGRSGLRYRSGPAGACASSVNAKQDIVAATSAMRLDGFVAVGVDFLRTEMESWPMD